MNYHQQERVRFIDFLLDRFGMFNRGDIADYFGLSDPQASRDIRDYMAQAPGNTEYDLTDRCYRRCAAYARRFP